MAIRHHIKGEARERKNLKQQNANEIKAGRPATILEPQRRAA